MVNIVRRNGGESREMTSPRQRAWDPFRMMRELLRWDPFAEMEGMSTGQAGLMAPPVEVRETNDSYVFKVELPGISEKDVEISMTGNRLTISGERRETDRTEGDRFYACEFSYGGFSRTFTLPEGTDPDNVRAEMRNGVLQVLVPKRPEVKAKRIAIGPQTGQLGSTTANQSTTGTAAHAGGMGSSGGLGGTAPGGTTPSGASSSSSSSSSASASGQGRKP